jgi:hypothetical protein
MVRRLIDGDMIPAGRVNNDHALILADREAAVITVIRKGVNMRVGIATDHGGFHLKEDLLVRLKEAGHEVVDFGAHSLNTATIILILLSPSRSQWWKVRLIVE